MVKNVGIKGEGKKPKDESRRAAEQLMACMRLTAIGQLTAGVAHELNNPLSVILGFAQSLMQQVGDEEAIGPSIKTIEREALRCKRLVQDLLNFSRLPRPGKVMEDPLQVLEGALSLVEAQARIQNVELVRDFTDPLPMMYIDRHRIQQMVVNLCTNAMDAMPKGGRLTVHAALVPRAKSPPSIEIQVRDTGTGIPLEIREKMFEPFFTTKELGKGTGLGLSLVREVVEEHEGSIEVTSDPGRGSVFFIRLPTHTRSASPRPDGKNPAVSRASF
jgi:signal transduction histidine kinase